MKVKLCLALLLGAISIGGCGVFDESLELVIDETTCRQNMQPPASVSVVPGATEVSVYWDLPPEGDCLAGYRVKFWQEDDGTIQDHNPVRDPRVPLDNLLLGTSTKVIGLLNGVSYCFSVQAVSTVCYGNECDSSNLSPPVCGVPDPDFSETVYRSVVAGDGRVVLYWASATEETAQVFYNVYYAAGDTPFALYSEGNSAATNRVVDGLTNDVLHQFLVRKAGASGKQGPAIGIFKMFPSGDSSNRFGTITGKVMNSASQLVEGAKVVVRDSKRPGNTLAFAFTDEAGKYELFLPEGNYAALSMVAGYDSNNDGDYFSPGTDPVNAWDFDFTVYNGLYQRNFNFYLKQQGETRNISGQIIVGSGWDSAPVLVRAIEAQRGDFYQVLVAPNSDGQEYLLEVPAGNYRIEAGLDLNADGIIGIDEPRGLVNPYVDVTYQGSGTANVAIEAVATVTGTVTLIGAAAAFEGYIAYAISDQNIFVGETNTVGNATALSVDVLAGEQYEIGIFNDSLGIVGYPDDYDEKIIASSSLAILGDTSNVSTDVNLRTVSGYSWRTNAACVLAEKASGRVLRNYQYTSGTDGRFIFQVYQETGAHTYELFLFLDTDGDGLPSSGYADPRVYWPDGEISVDNSENLCVGCNGSASDTNPFKDHVGLITPQISGVLTNADASSMGNSSWFVLIEPTSGSAVTSPVMVPATNDAGTNAYTTAMMSYGEFDVRLMYEDALSRVSIPASGSVTLSSAQAAKVKDIQLSSKMISITNASAPAGWMLEAVNIAGSANYSYGRSLYGPQGLSASLPVYTNGTYTISSFSNLPSPRDWSVTGGVVNVVTSTNYSGSMSVPVYTISGTVSSYSPGLRVWAENIATGYVSDALIGPDGQYSLDVYSSGDYDISIVEITDSEQDSQIVMYTESSVTINADHTLDF
jgi:fibronectin type III domain protein